MFGLEQVRNEFPRLIFEQLFRQFVLLPSRLCLSKAALLRQETLQSEVWKVWRCCPSTKHRERSLELLQLYMNYIRATTEGP